MLFGFISDYLIQKWLNRTFGARAWTPPANYHFALFTTAPVKDGSGGVEVEGADVGANNYSRTSYTNSAANFPNTVSGENQKRNAYAITFAAPEDDWGTISAIGAYDAALGNIQPITVDTGTNVVNCSGHGYTDAVELTGAGSVVMFSVSGGSLPAPFIAGKPYYVREKTNDTFKVALTPEGSAIDIMTEGSGTMYVRSVGNLIFFSPVSTMAVPVGRIYTIYAGTVEITLPIFSDYLNRRLLDYTFGAQSFAISETHFALFSTIPDSAGAGGVEQSAGNYSRKAVTNDDDNFPDSVLASGLKFLTINGDNAFATPDADWADPVTAVGIYDGALGGNLLCVTSISYVVVTNGNPFVIEDEKFRILLN